MTQALALLAAVLAPGLFSWWSGRHLVRQRDDAALPERMLIRQQHAQHVLILSCALLAYGAGTFYWFGFLVLLVGSWIGDYPSRRVVLDEQWTLAGYLAWHARFTAGYLGFWFALLLAPSIIHSAGQWRWPAAAALAVLLGLWGHGYGAVLLWVVRARPLEAPEGWRPVFERSHAPRPRLLTMPVPGGRFVNAFALPSSRAASVLFTVPLLELLAPREQAAILAHEMAHLEHYDRRRCRLAAAAGYTLVVLATLGAALALEWLDAWVVVLGWSVAFVIAFALRTSRQKAHETESDRRALALCQDADALISGLTKLTTAGRVPRRWSSDVERYASHPSLAHRLQAIRRAAGIAESSTATEALVISTAEPGARLILDDRGVSWLTGVGATATNDPALLRQLATASWSIPYTELIDLRVAASWWGGASLRVRDHAGTERVVRIPAAELQALQQRLDAVEARLPHHPARTMPPALLGRVTGAVLWIACIGALLPLGLVIGLVALVRPSPAALAAVAATAGAAVLVVFGDLAGGGHWTQAASATGAVLVMAAAGWLALKRRTGEWRKADYAPVLIAAGLIATVAWAQLAAQLLWRQRSSSLVMQTLGDAPTAWASLAVIGCALMMAPRRAGRTAGVTVLVAAILLNLGVRISDLEALSRVVAPPADEAQPLPRMAGVALPARGASMRVSPLGGRVAVAVRASSRDDTRRFLVLGFSGARTELEADDLHFIDEDNALIVIDAAEGTTVQHIELADGAATVRGGRVVLPGLTALRLSSVRNPAWAGVGYDAATENRIGVIGRIGSDDSLRQPLHDDDMEEFGGAVALTPDGRWLRTAIDAGPLARVPWGALLHIGRLPHETHVWQMDRQHRPQLIATLPALVGCQLAGAELRTVVCVGTNGSRTLIWRFDVATPPSAPLIVPGLAWRSAVSRDGGLVALWSGDEVLMVDLRLARAQRWTFAPAAGFPVDVVPTGDRLITLRYSRAGASVDVYNVGRTDAALRGRATP